jgi:hypothetical protein
MAEALEREAEFDVTRRREVRRGVAGLALSLLLIAAGPTLDGGGVLTGFVPVLILLAGLVVGGVSLASLVRSRFRRGQLTIDRDGVRLGDDFIPRAAITSAWFSPGAGQLRASVRLVGEGDRELAQVAVGSEAEANELLDALALGPRQRTARFSAFAPSGGPTSMAAYGAFALGFLPMVAVFLFGAPGLVALSVLIWSVASALFVPCQVHVGADGLLIATRLAPTFIPWSEVEAIEYYERGVVVRRKEGEIRIPTAQPGRFANDYDRALQQGLFTRASQALAAYRSGEQPDAAARVARRGRPHGEWIRDLFDREGSFRVAPVLDDQLWRVVESPTAEATARAGAAAVLARTADESGRSRLRIAADACTAPRLRIVLDRTASGASEAEVEEALVEVEEEDDTRRGA